MSGSATPEAIMTPERSVSGPDFRVEEIQGWHFGTLTTPTQLIMTGGCDGYGEAVLSLRRRAERLMLSMEQKDELRGTDHSQELEELERLVWKMDMSLDRLMKPSQSLSGVT